VIDSRVRMVRDDTWARMDWIGTLKSCSKDGGTVRVKWDNGESYLHQTRDVIIIDGNEPNSAFQMHKLKKKGFKI